MEFRRPANFGALVPVASNKRQVGLTGRGRSVRLSSMEAPIMLLMGHEGEIYSAKFSPDGTCIASSGFDMKIFLWNVYGECENFSVLRGHTGAVMELHFSTDSSSLFTCSTDKTMRIWDMESGNCLRKLKGHDSFVNSCHPARRGPQMVCSGSDDGTIKVWDTRQREATMTFQNTYQVTAVSFNDTTEQVISGGIDNDIKIWDMRKGQLTLCMRGHTDTVTGLRLSPDGSHILSNSMDCTARIWDVRPFAPEVRCIKVFQGHQHNFEKNLLRCAWSPDGHRISCGSSDRFLYVWDVSTRRIVYKLPGHQGSVNETDFHSQESIIGGKVSGTAAKLTHNKAYHHFTLLVDGNLGQMKHALRPSLEGIQSRATSSVRAHVATLSQLNPDVNASTLVQQIAQQFSDKYESCDVRSVDPSEMRHLRSAVQELKSWDWTFGKTPPFHFTNSLRQLTVEVDGGLIKNVLYQGQKLQSSETFADLPLTERTLASVYSFSSQLVTN